MNYTRKVAQSKSGCVLSERGQLSVCVGRLGACCKAELLRAVEGRPGKRVKHCTGVLSYKEDHCRRFNVRESPQSPHSVHAKHRGITPFIPVATPLRGAAPVASQEAAGAA